MGDVFLPLVFLVLLAGLLLFGVFVGDNLPWRGRRARFISAWLALLSAPGLLLFIAGEGPGWLNPLSYYVFTAALAWRARIWWNDRELVRRRSLRAARRRARIYPSREISRRLEDS